MAETYKDTGADTVKRGSDGAFVPKSDTKFREWVAAGNTPDPADQLPAPIPDPDAALADAIEAATTLPELKAALLGTLRAGQKGRVAGRSA